MSTVNQKTSQLPKQMVFNPGNQVLAGASFGKGNGQMKDQMINENTMGFGALSQANDTKMSDNEAFMAYMNKAGHDEDDDWF